MHGDTVVATFFSRGIGAKQALQFFQEGKLQGLPPATEASAAPLDVACNPTASPLSLHGNSQCRRKSGNRRTRSPLQLRCRVVFIEKRSEATDSLLAVMHPQTEKIASFAQVQSATHPLLSKSLDLAGLPSQSCGGVETRARLNQVDEKTKDTRGSECTANEKVGWFKAQPRFVFLPTKSWC